MHASKPGSLPLAPPPSPAEPAAERLDSWKEIAAYLKRDESTVRRWEAEGLPVHRLAHKKKATVYAYKSEIDTWWRVGGQHLEASDSAPTTHAPPSRRWWIAAAAVALLLLVALPLVFNIGGLRTRLFASTEPAAKIESIAVLPLKNLMGDAEQDYFVEGMHEALTAELSKISALKVISRTSTSATRGRTSPCRRLPKSWASLDSLKARSFAKATRCA